MPRGLPLGVEGNISIWLINGFAFIYILSRVSFLLNEAEVCYPYYHKRVRKMSKPLSWGFSNYVNFDARGHLAASGGSFDCHDRRMLPACGRQRPMRLLKVTAAESDPSQQSIQPKMSSDFQCPKSHHVFPKPNIQTRDEQSSRNATFCFIC